MGRRSDEAIARALAKKRWTDAHGPLRVMTVCAGYVMVRRRGAAPFLVTLREFGAKTREVATGRGEGEGRGGTRGEGGDRGEG